MESVKRVYINVFEASYNMVSNTLAQGLRAEASAQLSVTGQLIINSTYRQIVGELDSETVNLTGYRYYIEHGAGIVTVTVYDIFGVSTNVAEEVFGDVTFRTTTETNNVPLSVRDNVASIVVDDVDRVVDSQTIPDVGDIVGVVVTSLNGIISGVFDRIRNEGVSYGRKNDD